MKAKQHDYNYAVKAFLSLSLLVLAALLLNLAFVQNAQAANAKVISANATGGDCTTVGTWDPATLTCTLTSDIAAGANNGISITANGITLDGNGHAVNGSGGFTTGVSMTVRSNVTIKNLTVNNFNYGFYLSVSSSNQIFNNNLTADNIPAYVSGGSGNVFNQPGPVGGNYWSNYTGCVDGNGDNICDAAYVFTGGQDNMPWTTANGWLVPPAPDVTAPAISGVTPSGIVATNSPTINVSYSDTESHVNTATVVVTLDSAPLSGCTVTTTSASCPTSGLAFTAHTIGGTVSDNAGNVATISGGFTIADSTPPTVTNVLPSGAISTTSTTVSASYSDDLSGINTATVSVSVDAVAVSGCTITATGVSCPTTGLAQGSHSISVSVTDVSGNTGAGTGSFVVDTMAPAVTNIQPVGTITTSSTTISASYSDGGSGINVASATVTLDGVAMSGCSATVTGVSCPATALASGTHNIGVSVRDAAGNTGTGSSSFQVVAPDTTPPTVSNITPAGAINITNPTINADLADLGGSGVNAASAAISIDAGAALTGCTATASHISCPTTGLAVGGHTIAVSVSDGAGNAGSGSGSFSIDTTIPTVSAVAPAGTINVNSTTLSANYADGGSGINSSSAVVKLDGATVPGCTASAGSVSCMVSGLPDGLHAITVSVNDNAGNNGSGSGSFTVDTTVSPKITTNTNYITNDATGGSCTAIGTWNPATLTCTLTTDIDVNTGKAGISVTSNGITIDGNDHKITSLGGYANGVAVTVKSNVTVKNLTIKSFNYGMYLTSATSTVVYHDNFVNNTTSAYASGGSGNVFDQPMPDGGNYWSSYSTPAQGCVDAAIDGRCDAANVFTGGQDNNPWTAVNGWKAPPVPDTTPPTVSSVLPSGVINTRTTTVSADLFDGESGVNTASVVMNLETGTLLGCTVSTTHVSCPVSGLSVGLHTISGTVRDMAGNPASISGSFNVVDSTAPVVSGLLPTGSVNSTSTTISASFSDDLSGINSATATVTMDTVAVGGCTATASGVSCAVSGMTQGTHNVNVSVQDNSGNTGTAAGSFIVDTTAPAVTNVLPVGTITTSTATISADYSDAGSGINAASASIHLDGALLPMSSCTANAIHISCTATALASGTHTISVSVADNAGNAGTGTGTFDSIAPDTTPPTASNITPSGWINVANPTINADLADLGGSGVNAASATIKIDTGAALTGCTANATHISCPATGVPAGAHTITVNVSDNAGNAGSGTGSFNVDQTAPTVGGLAPTGTINTSSTTLTATYADAAAGINSATATITLDTVVVTGCSGTATGIDCPVTGLANGTHNMSVSVADNAGNTGTTTGSFIVDTAISPKITTNTNTISNNATGGDCATIGTWNAGSLTCTLNTDIDVNSGKNGISIASPGITIDGNGHKITSLGGYASGVYDLVKNDLTVKNLTIGSFNYGVYLLSVNNGQVYHNNFISNNTQAYVSGGSGNLFNLPLPTGGNYWNSFDTPAKGCSDINADSFCDAAYTFTSGSDMSAWTYKNAWIGSDPTPPSVTNVLPTGTINTGSTTISASYSDTGSGINQSSVSVSLDGTVITGCTVNATGVSCPKTGLALGLHTISGSVADSAGNVAPIGGTFTVVDNTAPVISGIIPTGTISGTSTTISANYTDDLSGINSSTVSVYLDGARLSGCTASASSVSCMTSVTNGIHSIAVNVADNSGNNGVGNGSFTVSNDVTPPAITNVLPAGYISTTNVTVSANYSDAGGINTNSVVVKLDGVNMTGCVVNSSAVSCLANSLAPGAHTITINVSDLTGNVGTNTGSFTIDTTAPVVSNIMPSGAVNTPSVTLSASLADAGSGINSATAAVYLDSVKVTGCTATATSISCPGVTVVDGNHTVLVTVDDNIGNHGSNNATFTLDRSAPVVGSITPSGSTTNASPILAVTYSDVGSGINTAAVYVYLDGATVSGCVIGPNSANCPVSALGQGSHSISVAIQDLAGNNASGAGSFTVDSIAPAVTNVQPGGWLAGTSTTVSAYFSDTGSGINSASANVYLDSAVLSGCTATATSVSCPVSLLAQGSHSVSVNVKDNAGNIGTGTNTFSVDTVAPSVTGILPSGTISSASATVYAYFSDATSGVNTATVAVKVDTTTLTGCTVGAGTVSCPVTGLTQGAHTITVTANDNAGNVGTGTGSFTVDTVAPAVSGITPTGTVYSATSTVYANYTDATSGINTATVAVKVDTTTLTGCSVAAGSVSCPSGSLANGTHTITVTVNDNAGNVGTGTGTFTKATDTVAPAVTGLSPTGIKNSATQTVYGSFSDSGSGINTSTATLTLDGTVQTGCTTTAISISCPATGLAQGVHNYAVTVRDNAGNTGSASASFTVDTVAPAVTGITPTGTITSASTTVYANYSDATSGINSSTASVTVTGGTVGTCTRTATNISCPVSGLANGSHTITVNVSDNASNAGTGTGTFTVNVSSGPPNVTSVTPTGTITTDNATINVYYTMSGTVNSAASYVYLDNIPLTTCTYSNTQASCPRSGLKTGSHTITGRIYDNNNQYGAIPSTSFTVSISNKMNLQLQVNGTMQLSGTQLTVPLRVRNVGSTKAYNVRLTAVTNSNGVTYVQPGLPFTFASSISGGSNSSTRNLTYTVPSGVTGFYTYCIVTASTASSGGTTYTYYLPLQITGWSTGGD